MTMTPAEVRNHEFARAARFTRGYNSREVDAFVESVAVRLESGTGISSNDVYRQTFSKPPLAERGYAEHGVDVFLDQVHAELVLLEDAWGQPAAAGADDPAKADPETPADADAEAPEVDPEAHTAEATPDRDDSTADTPRSGD